MAKSEQPSPPSALGSTPALGETFTINLSTGQGTYSYQIPLPAGVAGHAPRLVLEYVHGVLHDAWGLGWRLQVRRISRRLDFGAPEEGSIERFYDDDNEIVPSADGTFRAARETLFSRYNRSGDGWLVKDRNGVVHRLGTAPASRVADPDRPARVIEWRLERSTDVSGNQIAYGYRMDQGFAYLASVRYAVYEVRLEYEARPDVRHDGRAAFSRRRALRCTSLKIFLDPGPTERLIRSYTFSYRIAPGSAVSQLAAIAHTAHGAAPDGSQDVRRPTVSFSYYDFDPKEHRLRWMKSEGAPPPLSAPDVAPVTLDDAPLPGVLRNRNGRHFYWPNRAAPPFRDPDLVLADTDNDGLIDPLASWRRPFVNWQDPGVNGWSAPYLVPKRSEELWEVDLSDPDVFLADMTGDGAADLVRVHSGRVEYWPSLGRGRFGSRVTMENPPRLRRDVRRDTLLFLDVDGDGCADLVHLSARGLTICQNRNGLSFAPPVFVAALTSPLPGTARAVNLNGRSGFGLVWNSRARRGTGYVHFECTGEAPYLLARVDNGSGLSTRILYRCAVEDYRCDRDLGARWSTNFPFPYLVVGGTREEDAVSGRATAVDFLYREAHFERHTRQFQGFRTSERIERGEASRPDTRLVHRFLVAQERLPGQGRDHAVLNGLLSRIETYRLDGSPLEGVPLRVETSEYELAVLDRTPDGRARTFVKVTVHRQEDLERGADARVEEKSGRYDGNGNPQGVHLYAANDPLNRADVTGLSFWSVVGGGVGVAVGIVVAATIICPVVATGGTLRILLGAGLTLAASLLVTRIFYRGRADHSASGGYDAVLGHESGHTQNKRRLRPRLRDLRHDR